MLRTHCIRTVTLFCGTQKRVAALCRVATSVLLMTLVTIVADVGAPASVNAAPPNQKQLEFFESKIRPVLVGHCYECHSADSKEVKGGLLLDSAQGLLIGGDSGPALIAGKPDESPLIDALRYDGLEMPPEGRLPKNVVRDFEEWVRLGAADPRTNASGGHARAKVDIEAGRQFWAFQPPQDVIPPLATNGQPYRNSVDAFINAELKAAHIRPAGRAAKETLIRRLYFDLIGLPPTTEQLKAALADESSDAIEKLADRLLHSSQYGIHWGRHWLDVARYADSNGGDFNATFHNAWKYRDYVVDSFNEDKPFDEFVREQIAGDLLPFEDDVHRTRQIIATGFLMIGTKMLSERDKEKLTMDVVDEQISSVGSAFMGLTLGCARCHDHKFDPIPSTDYYALAGIFRSTRTLQGESQKYVSTWPKRELPTTADHRAAVNEYASKKKEVDGQLKAAKAELGKLKNAPKYDRRFIVDDSDATTTGDWKPSKLTPRYVGTGYIHDDRKQKGEKSIEYRWTAPKSGEYEVRLSYTHHASRANNVPVSVEHADGRTDIVLNQQKKPEFDELFSAVGRFSFDSGREASVLVSTTGTTGFVIADAVQFVEIDNAGNPVSQSSAADNSQPAKSRVELQKKIEELETEQKRLKKLTPPKLPTAIAVADVPECDDCNLRIRGEHKNTGAKIPRGFVQVVSRNTGDTFDRKSSGRLQLANWLTDPDHPLTARVIVNRVWLHLFGEGIVRSADNFGQLGDRPSHPKLLDHLARRFVTPQNETTESGASGFGWSIRLLVREIVLSNAYQRATDYDEAAWQADPENRLLWRMSRRRIPAEAIRDGILSISRRLDLSPGGSPVEGLGTLVKSNSADADDYQRNPTVKRSLYLPIIRNELPSILTVFDFANPGFVVGKRSVTNVPAQALFLMNSPFVMDNARLTAEWICEKQSGITADQVRLAYLAVLARSPTATELNRATEFLNEKTESADSEKAARRLGQLIHVLFASTEFRMLD